MSISTLYSPDEYIADGVEDTFPITFNYLNDTSTIKVLVDDVVQVYPTKYTFDLDNNVLFDPLYIPAANAVVNIELDLTYLQGTEYTRNSIFPANTVENDLDRITLMAQVLKYDLTSSGAGGGVNPDEPLTATVITATDHFVGNITGNVTGNTTGTHTGAVTGNVTGNVTGTVTGNTTGTHIGSVTGSQSNSVTYTHTGTSDSVALSTSGLTLTDTSAGFTTTLTRTDPLTGNRTVTLPDASGTVLLSGSPIVLTSGTSTTTVGPFIVGNAESASGYETSLGAGSILYTHTGGSLLEIRQTAEDLVFSVLNTGGTYEQTVKITEPLANGTITFPNTTGTVALTSDISALSSVYQPLDANIATSSSTNTFTNKTINCDSTGNVITNIGSSEVKSELITGMTTVTAAAGDLILVADVSDSNNLKKVTVQTIVDLAAGGTAASQSDQETATSSTVVVTPGRQQYHPSSAKAWGVFNMSGTLSSSYNVTSVTDNGAGSWTINFTTAFSSANYCVIATGFDHTNQVNVRAATKTTGSCSIECYYAGNPVDPGASTIEFVCFGDQ